MVDRVAFESFNRKDERQREDRNEKYLDLVPYSSCLQRKHYRKKKST